MANGDLHPASDMPPCCDVGEPTSPPDPDSARSDMGASFFNVRAPGVIRQQPTGSGPCALTVGFGGHASPAPCPITLDEAPTRRFGIFFHGLGAPATVTIAFGDICVGAPYVRGPAIFSGGLFADGSCAGRFGFDVNGFIQSGLDPHVVAGSNLIGHLWWGDPFSPAFATISDGARFPVCP